MHIISKALQVALYCLSKVGIVRVGIKVVQGQITNKVKRKHSIIGKSYYGQVERLGVGLEVVPSC